MPPIVHPEPAAGPQPPRPREHLCRRLAQASCLVSGVLLLAAGLARAGEPTPIPIPLDQPEKVFKATLGERFSNLAVGASALYHLLEAGDLVLINYHPASADVPWLSTAGTIVDAPPSTVYQVIADVAHYHEFMPETKSASATSLAPGIDRVDLELSIQVLLTSITNAYALYYYYQPPTRIDWTLARGEFEANIGAFELVSVPGQPLRTVLLHTSYALPRNRILNSLFARVPDLDLMVNLTTGTMMMEAVKKRAEDVYRRAGGKVQDTSAPADVPALLESLAETLDSLARRGPVMIVERGPQRYYTGVMRVKRPRSVVYEAVTRMDEVSAAIPYYSARLLEQSSTTRRYEVESVIPLMIDFDADYVLDASLTSPTRVVWTPEPGGDLEGFDATWLFLARGERTSLVIYRNRSDLRSLGFTMRKLLEVEPLFEHGIHISETQRMLSGVRRWAEASPEARARLGAE